MKKKILLLFFSLSLAIANAQEVSKFIIVDQFGYLPDSKKICVIKDPQTGFDSDESYTPGNTYSLVNVSTGLPVYTASPVMWKSGATDVSSGDKAWHFNFSIVKELGRYYVLDLEKNRRSYEFEISPIVYNEVLKQVVRSFFYQRLGFPKESQFAGIGWADGASHIGPLQDKNCRLFSDKNNPDTELDLSGGWYDAGDYNKYTIWTSNYVVEMMKAYIENPAAWADDYNIPESGNGIPDLLDEAKWGIDFLLRMQRPNGSVLSIVGESHASPPSSAKGQSLYGPATTSASLNTAAAFALASKIYRLIDMNVYADTLLARSQSAWNWAVANPNIIFNNNDPANSSLVVGAGNQEEDNYTRSVSKLEAACFLFEQTGELTYRNYFDANYQTVRLILNSFAYPFEGPNQDALLYYTRLPGATVSVANTIRNKYKNSMLTGSDNFPAITNMTDPYGAHLSAYTWGSNGIKCVQGIMYYNLLSYAIDSSSMDNTIYAAQAYIHYIHGVNPLNFVYLSNMYKFGGDNGVNEFYHSWFENGSAKWDRVGKSLYGPPPGFLTGGANPGYNWAACCPSGCGSTVNNAICLSESISPPFNQPKQKSYKDFNTSWPLNSWEITENSCGYAMPYIRLLSKFVNNSMDCKGDINGTASLDICGNCSGGNTGIDPETNPCNCIERKLETVLNINACSGEYISPSGKYIWTDAGTYRDTLKGIYGCDSLIVVNLTTGINSLTSISASACETYISPSGKKMTVSGNYTDTIPNATGCDSIISIELKIGKNSKSTIYPVSCVSFVSPDGMQIWTSSGIYSNTIPSATGCDSVITIKLTVRKVVVTARLIDKQILADATSGTFRWFNFSGQYNVIEGAVGRLYTPSYSGEYAVEVTQNGCVDTSALFLVIVSGSELNTLDSRVSIYPNPSSGKIMIKLPYAASKLEVDLKNALGQSIRKEVFYGKKEMELSLNAPAGMYILVLKNERNEQIIKKLILEQ
jgi:hypothetical protein